MVVKENSLLFLCESVYQTWKFLSYLRTYSFNVLLLKVQTHTTLILN